jgi:hypothetical protein
MPFGLTTAAFIGGFVFLSLITTAGLGLALHKGKPVFKWHRFFAFLTIALAIIHAISVLILYYG